MGNYVITTLKTRIYSWSANRTGPGEIGSIHKRRSLINICILFTERGFCFNFYRTDKFRFPRRPNDCDIITKYATRNSVVYRLDCGGWEGKTRNFEMKPTLPRFSRVMASRRRAGRRCDTITLMLFRTYNTAGFFFSRGEERKKRNLTRKKKNEVPSNIIIFFFLYKRNAARTRRVCRTLSQSAACAML